jgi:hypothetical protein
MLDTNFSLLIASLKRPSVGSLAVWNKPIDPRQGAEGTDAIPVMIVTDWEDGTYQCLVFQESTYLARIVPGEQLTLQTSMAIVALALEKLAEQMAQAPLVPVVTPLPRQLAPEPEREQLADPDAKEYKPSRRK